MTLVTTFTEKRRERQLKFERSLLREISVQSLKRLTKECFGGSRFTKGILMDSGIEEACFDVAIEAYLLGGRYSRLGYLGESEETAKERSSKEERHLIDTLFNFFLFWGNGDEGIVGENLYYLCERYVDIWWREGFKKGEKKHKLRLH